MLSKGTSSRVDYIDSIVWPLYGFNAWLDQTNQVVWVNGEVYPLGARCYMCPLGFYASRTGLTLCNKCPDGYSCADRSASPVACPRGYYYNSSSNNQFRQYGDYCDRCPPGTYSNKTGSTSCLPCSDGMSCPDPTFTPSAVPTG